MRCSTSSRMRLSKNNDRLSTHINSMKLFCLLFLFVLTITSGWAQQALVNPTSVTLTQPGPVTVIITGQVTAACEYGNTGRTTPPIHVSVGTVQATYSFALGTSMAELGVVTNLMSSSVATGTLDAGTYSVTSDATVTVQITVILWNESATSGSATNPLSDLTLAYGSATDADKAAFKTLIVSLVQQQLDTLQAQINTQQSQINSILSQLTTLQNANTSQHADLQNQIDTLQATVESQYNSITSLQQSLATSQTQYSQLSDTLTSLTTRVNSVSSGTSGSGKSDDTLTDLGIGLGAAGVIGGIVNFFTGDGHADNSSAADDVLYTPERNNP